MKKFFKALGCICSIPFLLIFMFIAIIAVVIKCIIYTLQGDINEYRREITFKLFVLKDILKVIKNGNKINCTDTFTYTASNGSIFCFEKGLLHGQPVFEINEYPF